MDLNERTNGVGRRGQPRETIEPERDVTVVIPDRNRPRKLRLAVESVIEQTRQPREIIIVDDASNPPLRDDDFSFSPVSVRILRHEIPRGAAAARNTGIRSAQTEWVGLLDSDDIWLPHRLDAQAHAFQEYERVADALCANVLNGLPDAVDGPLNHRPLLTADDISRYLLEEDCALHTSSLLIRRKLLLTVPFDERLRKHQDWDLVLRLRTVGAELLYIHEPLAVYCRYCDGDRISEIERDVALSVEWLQNLQHLIAPEAAAHYYAHHCAPRAFRASPWTAARQLAHLALRSRPATHATLRGLQSLLSDHIKRAYSRFLAERP